MNMLIKHWYTVIGAKNVELFFMIFLVRNLFDKE